MEDLLISAGTKIGVAAFKMLTSGKKPGAGAALGAIAGAFDEDGDAEDFGDGEEEVEFEEEDAAAEEYDVAEEEQYTEESQYAQQEGTYQAEENQNESYYEENAYGQADTTESYYTQEDTYDSYEWDATDKNPHYYEDPAIRDDFIDEAAAIEEQTYTNEFGITYDEFGNVIDTGSEATYEYVAEDTTTYGQYNYSEGAANAQYEDSATATSTGSSNLGIGLAAGGATVLGGAAYAARRGRGRARSRGTAPAGRGNPPSRGRGTPIPQRGHSNLAAGRATVGRGRGALARGRGRGGPGQPVARPQQALSPIRGGNPARSRGPGRVGRQSQHSTRGRARGQPLTPTTAHMDTSNAPIGTSQPPTITSTGNSIAAVNSLNSSSAQNIPASFNQRPPNHPNPLFMAPDQVANNTNGFSTTVGPIPGTVSHTNMSYMTQAPHGIVMPNAGVMSPPPPYYAVVYNNTAPAPTQRRTLDPTALEQISRRKLEALQRIQQKEKERIEAKRREEEMDREQGRGSNKPQNLSNQRVHSGNPSYVAATQTTTPSKPQDNRLPHQVQQRPPVHRKKLVQTQLHEQISELGRTPSVMAPQVVEPGQLAGFTQTTMPSRRPHSHYHEIDGTEYAKPAPVVDNSGPTSYNSRTSKSHQPQGQARFANSHQHTQHHTQSNDGGVAELGITSPVTANQPIELGNAPMTPAQESTPQTSFHAGLWGARQATGPQAQAQPEPARPQHPAHANSWAGPEHTSQQVPPNQGPQRSLSMLQRFPSRKPVHRPMSMVEGAASKTLAQNTEFRSNGFNQPPSLNGASRNPNSPPVVPLAPQLSAGSPHARIPSVGTSVDQEEEEQMWKPPPLKTVQRRRFNSGGAATESEDGSSREFPDTTSQGTASSYTSPTNTAFEAHPPLPNLPNATVPGSMQEEREAPLTNKKPSHIENISPETHIPGLRVRRRSASSIASSSTNHTSHVNQHTQFENQAFNHQSVFANPNGHQNPRSHETSSQTSPSSSPAYTYAAPVQPHVPHAQTFPSTSSHRSDSVPSSPLTGQHHNQYFNRVQNEKLQPLPEVPAHVMEMPASTGWAHSNKKSPYDMNPMIAELPEVSVPPSVQKQDIENNDGGPSAPPAMSANNVSFGWDFY